MKRFKENVIRGIVKMGKKGSRLIMPAIVLAAVFLACYHTLRAFCLQFRYHPVRQRMLAGILILSLLAGEIGLVDLFAATDSGANDTEDAGQEAVMTVADGEDGTENPSGSCGSNLTWTLDLESGTLTISGSGKMTDYLTYPQVPWYNDYAGNIKMVIIENGVTSIGNNAFYYCSALESIEIPSSVTSIGIQAFVYCSALESIEIPESVTSIGKHAFSNCSALKSIKIPESVTSIENYTFANCSALESIEVPESVTSIGSYAFSKCSSLTSIEIPSRVTSIGNNAFYYCSALESIEIPESVTSIENNAFYYCGALESIEIPESVTSIGNYAFYYCSALTSIEIPKSVTSIEKSVFLGCSSLESIEIPESVTSIGNYAFSKCSSLTSIEIPESVTSIGSYAFSECKSLTSIEIPKSVTSIGSEAFRYCRALTLVIMEGTTPATLDTKVFAECKFVTDSKKGLVVPAGTRDAYIGAANWSSWADYIHGDHNADEPMTAWTDSTSLPGAAGNYYLVTDVTLGATWTVPDGTTKLCLNGHTITFESGYIEIGSGNTLYICDCDEQERGSICNSNGKVVKNSGILEVTGGSIKGTATSAPAIMNMPEGTVTIRNGKVSGTSTVTVTNNGSLSISGGSIRNSNSAGYAVNNLGMIELSGSPTLTGSKADINNLRSGAYIAVTDTLTGIFSIETEDKPAVDAPVTFTNSTTTAYNSTDNFTSADVNYKIQKNSSGRLELAVIAYTVTLNGNGGNSGTTLTSYTYGTRAVLPTDWKKTGYTFAGWYDNADCTGTAVTEISTTAVGDKEYWAKWVDDIAPVIGDLSYSYKPKNLWHWLIGKDDLIITVSVTEEGSGAEEITYTITPEGSAAKQKTAAIKNGTATITLSADFQGTIIISCTDKDGNASASVTAGATLDSDGEGFLIEDNAPEITFAANNGENISSEYYDAAPDITVTVTDDADNAISAGIASITYQIGNGAKITVNKDFATKMVTEQKFVIVAGDIPTGETNITVTATDNAGNEASGTITVKVKGPESKPAAAINYQTEMLTGLEPNAEYTINGIACRTDADGCIAIEESWIGTTIELVRKGNGTETTDSEAQEISLSARPDAPSIMPELDSLTDSSITLKVIDGAEYRLKDGSWQDSTEFTGLEAGTEYTFTVRYEATATAFASEESAPASFYTMPSAPAEGAAQIDYVQETLMLADGIEAFADEACTVPIASGSISDYIGQTIYIRYAADGEIPESGATAVTIPERPSAPAAGTQNATYPGAGDGKLTGLEAGTAYQISTDNGATWTDVTSDENGEITNLAPGSYIVRTGSTDTDFASEPSAPVTIAAYNDTGNSDNTTDNADNDTDNSDNASDSDDKEQPETPTVLDNQPDDKKEPTDERRDDTGSTRQEDEETPKQTEPSGETDTTNRIPEGDTVQTVSVEVNGGKLVLTGKPVETGNLTDTSKTTTVLMLGDGAVIVTVVCEDDHYTAEVKDTVAVANIVLTPEQLQLVYDGEVIEIRTDVTDISRAVGEQDKEVIEQGLEAWRQEIPELTLGMYVDISMFIRIGESDWDAITFTEEPIDIVIGIPEELKEDGRKFYIIRSHEGAYALLNDKDSDADTITISTDSFSVYAIAYQQVDSAIEEVTAEKTEESAKCGLCHICPTFLGICCFIWLAVIVFITIIMVIVLRKKREKQD